MLLGIMADYRGFKEIEVIVVFDAHYVKNSMEKHEILNGVEVVYTKEYESADNYIERFIVDIAKDNYVKVATSDWVEQQVVLGLGGIRVSSRELYYEIKDMKKAMRRRYIEKLDLSTNTLESSMSPEIKRIMESWRRGRDKHS